MIHGMNPEEVSPLMGGEPLMHNAIPYVDLSYSSDHGYSVTYESGVFYSPYEEITDEGYEIMNIATALDYLSPDLYFSPIINIYTGYESDEILHIYPGRKVESDYTPIVAEWYYIAANTPSEVVFSEPYQQEESNIWVISFSKAILTKDSDLFAVVGIDISLDIVNDEMNSIDVFSNGFLLQLSSSGIVINKPLTWSSSSSFIRIYESKDVDISYSQWLEINNTSISEDTLMSFTDSNSTEYFFTRSFVYPFEDKDYTSIIMVCLERDEVYSERDKLQDDFTYTFEGIFYFVLAVAIVCFSSIGAITFFISKRLTTQLEGIDRVLHRIVANASKTNLVDGINLYKIDKFRKEIETLSDACSRRIEMIGDDEANFSSVEWGTSRPSEVMQFEKWRKYMHPTNIYYQKAMPWKHLIQRINGKSEADTLSKPSTTETDIKDAF